MRQSEAGEGVHAGRDVGAEEAGKSADRWKTFLFFVQKMRDGRVGALRIAPIFGQSWECFTWNDFRLGDPLKNVSRGTTSGL